MMRFKNHKIFARLTILILLCAFLTFNVGKAQKTYALATVTTAAASAALTIGATYLVYVTLTGGSLSLPDASQMSIVDYVTDIGRSSIERSPTLQKAYNKAYQYCLDHPSDWTNSLVLDFDRDLLQGVYNDLKSVDMLQDIGSYSYQVDTTYEPTNGFSYPANTPYISDITSVNFMYNGSLCTYDQLPAFIKPIQPYGSLIVYYSIGNVGNAFYPCVSPYSDYRNVLKSNGKYTAQGWNGSTWVSIPDQYIGWKGDSGRYGNWLYPDYVNIQTYRYNISFGESTVPYLPHYPIYVEAESRYLPTVVPDSQRTQLSPNWNYPDDDTYLPFVPFVQLPKNVNSPTSLDKWGIKWSELWSKLQELAGTALELDAIRALINSLAGDTVINVSGDYLPYNDNDTNYFQYFDNSYNYEYAPIYNYYIGDQEDLMPVNLNEISQYTDNDYLDQIKEAAVNGGNVIRDYFVFWYNISPELVYAVFGSFILILVGAFIGKWGHS